MEKFDIKFQKGKKAHSEFRMNSAKVRFKGKYL